ncbi:MAG: hypothetical protein A3J27_12170 [Candidatus Tectomicrobia bacterium RIFCSPLOWO2_12_FULL_69_37]|nr:MAG: hypothetical protein A3J27_12170 [Candidatus Tectomicrobia bacterium RIFCSPLOWO2_12_FULL_69_37]
MAGFGRHIWKELQAAGISDPPFTLELAGGAVHWNGTPAEMRAATEAVLAAHDPAALVFAGHEAASAADVDRATARRIRALLAGPWADDPMMAAQAMLRKVEDLLAAVYVIEYKAGATQEEKDAARLLLDANWQMRGDQLQVLRQEGADFKAAKGW